MANKNRRIEMFNIYLRDFNRDLVYKKEELLEKIIKEFLDTIKIDLEKQDNILFDKGKDKKFWIDSYYIDENFYNIKLGYLRYNKKIIIREATTLKETGKKGKNEGDEEKQHFSIVLAKEKFKNVGLIIFESASRGIKINDLKNELNIYFNNFKKRLKETENSKNSLENLEITISSIPDKEFLQEIESFERISSLKVTVDSEKATLDAGIIYSQDNLTKKEVEIIYKPTFKSSLSKNKIKALHKTYTNSKNDKILRIKVEGRGKKGKIKLDTEGSKLNKYLEILLNDSGEISSSDIFDKYKQLFKNEIKDYLYNEMLELYGEDEIDN